MKIVSENSKEDLERHRKEAENAPKQRDIVLACQEVQCALTPLAANMLRIICNPATGGRSWEVSRQIAAVYRALAKYSELTGHLPFNRDIEEALSVYPLSGESGERRDGESLRRRRRDPRNRKAASARAPRSLSNLGRREVTMNISTRVAPAKMEMVNENESIPAASNKPPYVAQAERRSEPAL